MGRIVWKNFQNKIKDIDAYMSEIAIRPEGDTNGELGVSFSQ
jgi:hypothetical protein